MSVCLFLYCSFTPHYYPNLSLSNLAQVNGITKSHCSLSSAIQLINGPD